MLQLGTVSRKFAIAGSAVVQLQPSMKFWGPFNFGTALMLGLAPSLRRLEIGRRAIGSPGLAKAAAAATQLTALTLAGDDTTACTHADMVLQECHALQVLKFRGVRAPSVFPKGIQELKLGLNDSSNVSSALGRSKFAGGFTDVLMLRLASLQHLRHLKLWLGDTGTLPTSGQVCALQRLTVSFDVAQRRDMDLSWLQAQSHQELCMHVSTFANAAVQQEVSEQLQVMQLHDLRLSFWRDMEPEYQHIWEPITVTGRVTLNLHSLRCYIRHIPTGPDLYIHAYVESHEALHVAWQPLAAASRILIQAGGANEIRLVRPWEAEDVLGLTRAWQLTLRGVLVSSRHGLPPSQLPPSDDCEGGLYSWQNQAATSAGWALPTRSRDMADIFSRA